MITNSGIKVGNKVKYRDSDIIGKVKGVYYSTFLQNYYVVVKVGLFKKYTWFIDSIEKVEE